MKKVILLLFISSLICCATKYEKQGNVKPTFEYQSDLVISNLTEIEITIINDFLEAELKSDRYKSYKNFELFVIEEALKKAKPIYAYEYTYKNFYKTEKEKDYWILDSVQINKLKSNLAFEKQDYWVLSDFKKLKVNLLKYEKLRKIINSGEYNKLSQRLIIYISKPLIIDDKNALISFEIGNGKLGFNEITHFTVLMKKEGGKWIDKNHFEDGIFQ